MPGEYGGWSIFSEQAACQSSYVRTRIILVDDDAVLK